MKTIIAGSRDIKHIESVIDAIYKSGFEITEVVSGNAKGADRMGEWFAANKKLPVKKFIPDWNAHGKFAGIKRNREMADYADALIAIWDGVSRGTRNMIDEATKRGLQVYVHRVDV